MLPLKSPIVLAAGPKASFSSVHITRERPSGKVSAVVTFDVIGADGKPVGVKSLHYSGAQYNAFWESFSSGKFLYEELVRSLGTTDTVPKAMELEFTNPAPVPASKTRPTSKPLA